MKIGKILLSALLSSVLCVFAGSAQERPHLQERASAGREMREAETPETVARRKTDEMDAALNLSRKQYGKVYKLYLNEAKSRSSAKQSMRPPQGGGAPQGGMHGGAPSRMGGSPGMGGSAQMGGSLHLGGSPGMGGGPSHLGRPGSEPDGADEEAQMKKLRKILTEEQYAAWDRIQFDALFRRMPDNGNSAPDHSDGETLRRPER